MTDPFTRLHNEVLEALMKADLPAESRVLFAIWRKTFGFGKKADSISLSQFILMTNLSKSSLCRAIQSLIKKGIIIREEGSKTSFSKDFMKKVVPQVALPESGTTRKWDRSCPESGTDPVPKVGHTKEILKEIFKERALENKKSGNQTSHSKKLNLGVEKEFLAISAKMLLNDPAAQALRAAWSFEKQEFFSWWLSQQIFHE